MQKYGLTDALYLCFYSRALYQDVASRWKGLCFTYLAAVLALCAIPVVLRMQADLRAWITEEMPSYVSQVPRLTIANGNLTIEAAEPYTIVNRKTGDPVVVIDTTGQINSLEGSGATALLTKTTLVIRTSPKETRTFRLSDLEAGSVTIDKAGVYDAVESFAAMFPVLLYPFALLFSLLVGCVKVLLYSLAGMLYARRLHLPPDIKAVIRMSAVAMTPSLLIGVVLTSIGTDLPYWWLAGTALSVGYLVFGINAYSENTSSGAV